MTDQRHPITPPPELVEQWVETWHSIPDLPDCRYEYIATQAARWGDGQRLEACCEWLREAKHHGLGDEVAVMLAGRLRAAMRPKPPSVAEEALRILVENGRTFGGCVQFDLEDVVAIRTALKRLQQLEQENNG